MNSFTKISAAQLRVKLCVIVRTDRQGIYWYSTIARGVVSVEEATLFELAAKSRKDLLININSDVASDLEIQNIPIKTCHVPGPLCSKASELDDWTVLMSGKLDLKRPLQAMLFDRIGTSPEELKGCFDESWNGLATVNLSDAIFLLNTYNPSPKASGLLVTPPYYQSSWSVPIEDAISMIQFGSEAVGKGLSRAEVYDLLQFDTRHRLKFIPSGFPPSSRFRGGVLCKKIASYLSQNGDVAPIEDVIEMIRRSTGRDVSAEDIDLLSSEMGGFQLRGGDVRSFL